MHQYARVRCIDRGCQYTMRSDHRAHWRRVSVLLEHALRAANRPMRRTNNAQTNAPPFRRKQRGVLCTRSEERRVGKEGRYQGAAHVERIKEKEEPRGRGVS